MPDERLCPNCNQAVEQGATYCGNCGFKLAADQPTPQPTISQVYTNGPVSQNNVPLGAPAVAGANVPAYAMPQTHHKQHWAVMALAFGALGAGASVLIPILGIGLGICGIVLITSSFRVTHGWLKSASLVVSILAIAVGIGFWVNNIAHDARLNSTSNKVGTSNGVASINVSTPCYALTFSIELNVNNSSGSCSMNAYNGSTFQSSSEIYKVLSSQSSSLNSLNFASFSKQAVNQDLTKNLPGITITKQATNLFDGSPAYYVEGYDSASNVAIIEEAILHTSSVSVNKDNLFVIVHATSGQNVNLDSLERSWQWNG